MALHKDLTGAELHEPKGAATAASGTVYVANGSGSGVWQSRLNGLFDPNDYWLQGRIADISAPSSRQYFYVPVTSEMFELAVILDGPITTANDVVTIYINGVAFSEQLTVPFTGSGPGILSRRSITAIHSVPANSVIEVSTNGASDTVSGAAITLGLRQIS